MPGKFHGQRNLECYSTWGHKESDMTEHSTAQEIYLLKLKAFDQEVTGEKWKVGVVKN